MSQSFSSGFFLFFFLPFASKMIPTYEKDSRLEFLNFLILIQFRKDFDIIKYTIFWEKMGFQQKYSTTHALNHLTNSVINDMDRGNYTC